MAARLLSDFVGRTRASMITSAMRPLVLAIVAIVATAGSALAEEGDAALTCAMSNGSTVYFVRHYKPPGLIADNFEFYDSSGKITKEFRGNEADDKYRYWWGMMSSLATKKTEYVYEIDRFTLEITATFQSVFEEGVTRLSGKCLPADFKQTQATVAELKVKHEKEAEERAKAFKRKQELEEQERLSRRKI